MAVAELVACSGDGPPQVVGLERFSIELPSKHEIPQRKVRRTRSAFV